MGNKRQYHFEEALCMRTVDSYLYESRKADATGKNVKGHLGTSFLYQIPDVPLPDSILMDNMHITLLRRTRSVVLQIYQSIKPKDRLEIDNKLHFQQFPHTFNRELRPIKDEHVKYVRFIDYLYDSCN